MKKTIFALAVLLAPFALAGDAKVELTSNDQMQYNLETFEVTAGDKVTLIFKHIGQLPKVAMGHNVVILQAATPVPDFAMKASTAKDHDYIPQDAESQAKIVAHTKLIGGGESDTVTFTAPAAGSYPFLCTFPGHFAIMQGTMTVKAK